MKSRKSILIAVLVLFTALALPLQLAAQHIRYKLIDIPTLGGPAAYGNVDNAGFAQFINNPGVVVGGADSSSLRASMDHLIALSGAVNWWATF